MIKKGNKKQKLMKGYHQWWHWDNSTCAIFLWRNKIGLALSLKFQGPWLDELRAGNSRSALKIRLNHSSLEKALLTRIYKRGASFVWQQWNTMSNLPWSSSMDSWTVGSTHTWPTKHSSEFFHTTCIILVFIFIVLCVLSHILQKTEATFCCIYEEIEAQLKFLANFI